MVDGIHCDAAVYDFSREERTFMKRLVICAVILSLLLALAACSKTNADVAPPAPEESGSTVVVNSAPPPENETVDNDAQEPDAAPSKTLQQLIDEGKINIGIDIGTVPKESPAPPLLEAPPRAQAMSEYAGYWDVIYMYYSENGWADIFKNSISIGVDPSLYLKHDQIEELTDGQGLDETLVCKVTLGAFIEPHGLTSIDRFIILTRAADGDWTVIGEGEILSYEHGVLVTGDTENHGPPAFD